jgi:hypothetical protein
MKGPSERLKYDLRRLWECPVCNRRERTAGSVTYRFCVCQMKQVEGKPVPMKLVEDGIQRLTPTIAVGHETPSMSSIAEEQAAPVACTPCDVPPTPEEPPAASEPPGPISMNL